MKRSLLVIAGIAMSVFAVAQSNPFNKIMDKRAALEKMKGNAFVLPKVLGTETVPTLTKQSYWDVFNSSWMPIQAQKNIYQNDLLIESYQLTYQLNDTSGRVFYTYNAKKQLIGMLGEYKFSPGVYLPSYRYTITYSNNDLKSVVLAEAYDSFTQTWTPNSRQTEEVDTRGATTRYISEMYNNNMWEVQFAYALSISYLNNTDKMVELIDSVYDFNTNTFEANYKTSKNYNANGEVIDINNYTFDGSNLVLVERDSVFYTAGLPTKLVGYDYDAISNTFTKNRKFEDLVWNNFNPNTDIFNNEPNAYVLSAWDNNAWIFDERLSTTFPDNFGSYINLTEVYNSNSVWVNSSRYRETFDSKFNAIEYIDENYSTQTNQWETRYGEKFYFQYDASNNITERINEQFNSSNNAFEKVNKYEYSDFITISTGFQTTKNTLETTLFPNPSIDGEVSINVNIEASSVLTIKITDLKGSVVYTDKKELGNGLNTVELSGLQKGLYVVELSTEFGVARAKLAVN
jgi:hypothetical protein